MYGPWPGATPELPSRSRNPPAQSRRRRTAAQSPESSRGVRVATRAWMLCRRVTAVPGYSRSTGSTSVVDDGGFDFAVIVGKSSAFAPRAAANNVVDRDMTSARVAQVAYRWMRRDVGERRLARDIECALSSRGCPVRWRNVALSRFRESTNETGRLQRSAPFEGRLLQRSCGPFCAFSTHPACHHAASAPGTP